MGDGRWLCTYTPPAAGFYRLTLALRGAPVGGSPFSVQAGALITPCVSSFAGQEIRLVADGLFTPTLPASCTGARVHERMMACHLLRQVGCQRGRHAPGACSSSRPKKQPRVCWHC